MGSEMKYGVPGDVWTVTSAGAQQVKDLIGKPCTLVSNGKEIKVQGFFLIDSLPVIQIVTKQGYSVQVSENQPMQAIYDFNSKEQLILWSEGINLKNEKLIGLHNHFNYRWDGLSSFEDGYIIGWLIGDGTIVEKCLNSSRLDFYCDDLALISYCETILQRKVKYNASSDCHYIDGDQLAHLIRQYGLDQEKLINRHIESDSFDFYRGFLSAFFDADASVEIKERRICLAQSNLSRMQATQRMLLRLGIQASLQEHREAQRRLVHEQICNVSSEYRLRFCHVNCRIFKDIVGFQNPMKSLKLLEVLASTTKQSRNMFHTEIATITKIGKKPIYAVLESGKGSFDANGFILLM